MTYPGFVPPSSGDTATELSKLWRAIRSLQKDGPKTAGRVGQLVGGPPISFTTTETIISQTTCTVRPGPFKLSFQTQYGAASAVNVTWKVRYLIGSGTILDAGSAVPFGIVSFTSNSFDTMTLFKTIDFTDVQTVTIGVSAFSGGPSVSLPDGTTNRELLIEAI